VHSGAAFSIAFEHGVRIHQLTSSAISHHENILVAKACELASKTVTSIELPGGPNATVTLLRGVTPDRDRNPFGQLNIGLVDITDHADHIGIGLRLVSHDGEGRPVTVFDSGEIA
jgi:hypothetical protein